MTAVFQNISAQSMHRIVRISQIGWPKEERKEEDPLPERSGCSYNTVRSTTNIDW